MMNNSFSAARRSIRLRRLCCFLLIPVWLLFLAPGAARSAAAPSVRVYLQRLNLKDRADLTLTGRYLVRGGQQELLLPDGASVSILLREHQLILFHEGLSVSLGQRLSLLRQDSSGVFPGIRFNLQRGFYPGDLSLTVENETLLPVLTLPLETYLRGVVPYEMGDSFPLEALKAQAVCARTYALNHISAGAAWDVTDTTNDQVFRGLPDPEGTGAQAVQETAGLVLTWQGSLITAWYSASNGGQTELPAHVWGGSSPGCFVMQDDPWDLENPESVTRSCALNKDGSALPQGFQRLLRKAALDVPAYRDFIPSEEAFRIDRLISLELISPRFSAPSRLMTQLRVSFEAPPLLPVSADSADDSDLHIEDLLPQTVFTVTLDLFPEALFALGLSIYGADNELVTLAESDTSFTLTSRRYGHGVGLSQRGAQQMAEAGGKAFHEILSFYYPGAEIKKYAGEPASLPTPDPRLAVDPGPAPTATPRPTLMPVTQELPEGAWLASVENIDADSSLNLRARPSTGAEVLMRLYLHQPLIVLEESEVPGWVRVRTDQAEGYVMLSFLREAAPAE